MSEEFEYNSVEEFSDDEMEGDENYRGYAHVISDNFHEDDYDAEELVEIFRNSIRDLEKKVHQLEAGRDHVNEIASHSRKELNDLAVQYNQFKQEYFELKNQHLELQNEFQKHKQETADKLHEATENYFSEVRAHQKTMNELYDLKHAPVQIGQNVLSKPINIVAAVEVEVRNGKITKMNLKENVDKARADLIENLDQLTKVNEEHAIQIKQHEVVVLEHKREIEKEHQQVTELTQKVNDLEIIKAQNENTIRDRDDRIAELKKIVDDMQAKLEGKLASLDEKLDQKLEAKVEVPVEEEKEYEITDLAADDVEKRKKHIEERNKHLGLKNRRLNRSKLGSSQTPNALSVAMADVSTMSMASFSSQQQEEVTQKSSLTKSSGRKMRLKKSEIEEKLASSTALTKEPEVETHSMVPTVKAKRRRVDDDVSELTGLKSQLVDGGKQKTVNIGIETRGVIMIGDVEDKEKRVVIASHQDMKREYIDDFKVKLSMQTKHGFFVADEKKAKLITKQSEDRSWEVMDGIRNIGESEKGLLVVTNSLDLIELTGKHIQTKLMRLQEAPIGNVFMMKEMVFFIADKNKVRCYVVGMNFKCGNKINGSKICKVGSRLYVVGDKEHSKVYVYDERLNHLETIELPQQVVNIVNYNSFSLIMTQQRVYYVTRSKIVPIHVSEKNLISATLSGFDKKLSIFTLYDDNKVYKTPCPMKLHLFKSTSIKGVPCTICRKSNDHKMVFCGDCGMPCHTDCLTSYWGDLICNHFPCIPPEK